VAIKAYNSPGVTVSETVNPALAPVVASPSLVAIVGAASGSQSASERLVLSGTTAVQLANSGVSTGTVVVVLASTGQTLNAGNYVIAQSADPDTTVTGDELYTITRFASPSVAPTVAPSGTGSLTGQYEYAVSFTNANGETGIGPSNGPVNISGAGYNLSAIPLGPTGTTGRKIYRKKSVGTSADNLFHLVATIADNVATSLSNETTADATANNNSQPLTGIASGDTVVVNYSFTDQNYYEPTLFDDYSDVITKYGPPTDANGLVSSKLSYAIRLAFLNGASEVIGVAASADTQTPLEAALAQLEDEPDVNIIAIANGASFAAGSLYAHLVKMNAQGLYRIGIAARDGSTSTPTAATLRSAAQALNEESLRYVNVSCLRTSNSVTGSQLNLGAQFAAAAVAGMTAARDVQVPLTRKTIAGFEGINDKRTESEKALDSAAGLLVIEDRGGVLRIRHDITTAVGDVNKREASVVRAKYALAKRVRDALDTSVVGSVLPLDRGPTLVETVVRSVLEGLVVEEAIAAYSDVKGRLLSGDPTTVEVRFSYTPAYPINNINVVFQINTTTGDSSLNTA
jgi:hypothetical protein